MRTAAVLLVLAGLAAGCTATDTLGLASSPSSSAQESTGGDGPASAPTTIVDQSTVGAQGGQQIAAIPRDVRVQFAPVIGADAKAVPPLSSRLSARAKERGLAITPQGDGATQIVKGYFSTIEDEKGTTVIYVWDVLDPAGNRLHRIQGQEKARGSGEGWTAADEATMQAIADKTIDQLAAWLAGART